MADLLPDTVFNYNITGQLQPIDLDTIQPSYTYRVEGNRIIGMVDGLPAVLQAMDKLLRTERFMFPIYSENYGSELQSLVGAPMSYARADVERIITEAIMADNRIQSINDFTIMSATGNTLVVKFLVITVDNLFVNVEREVNFG